MAPPAGPGRPGGRPRSTSAPRSASTIAANGAGPRPAISTTRRPVSGPDRRGRLGRGSGCWLMRCIVAPVDRPRAHTDRRRGVRCRDPASRSSSSSTRTGVTSPGSRTPWPGRWTATTWPSRRGPRRSRPTPRCARRANLRGWLLTITSRCAMDAHRGRARRAVPAEDVADLAAASRRPRVAAGPDADRPDELLWTRVAALPERQRTAVVLKYVADLDHPTIARVLGTSPTMSRRLVSDALVHPAEGRAMSTRRHRPRDPAGRLRPGRAPAGAARVRRLLRRGGHRRRADAAGAHRRPATWSPPPSCGPARPRSCWLERLARAVSPRVLRQPADAGRGAPRAGGLPRRRAPARSTCASTSRSRRRSSGSCSPGCARASATASARRTARWPAGSGGRARPGRSARRSAPTRCAWCCRATGWWRPRAR